MTAAAMTAAGPAVEITGADPPGLAPQTFASLADAERAIVAAWARVSDLDPWAEQRVRYQLTWPDGWRFAGMVELRRADTARPGFLLTHLHYAGRTMLRPTRTASVMATGAALLDRLAAGGLARNGAAPPPLARVEILWSENSRVAARVYRSLADADVALARAFAVEPPPEGGAYDKVAFRVVWTDGEAHEGRADVRRVDLATSIDAGGVLRQHLVRVMAWLVEQAATSDLIPNDERAAKVAWGAELRRRLAAEPVPRGRDLGAPRAARRNLQVTDAELLPVGTTTEIPGVSILPDPAATVAALEGQFAAVRPPLAVSGRAGRTVPAATNRDVRHAANWLSLALAADLPRLRDLTGAGQGAIWDRWAKAIEHVRRHLGPDADATYRDNARFWDDQVPHLALGIASALGRGRAAGKADASW